jgi:hypothetical protein
MGYRSSVTPAKFPRRSSSVGYLVDIQRYSDKLTEEIPSVDPGSALQRPPATRRQPHVCPTADSEDSHTEHEPDNNNLNDDSDDEVPRSAQMGHSGHQKRQATAQLTREIARIPKRREVMVIEDDGDEETPNPSNNKRASRYRCLPDVLNL